MYCAECLEPGEVRHLAVARDDHDVGRHAGDDLVDAPSSSPATEPPLLDVDERDDPLKKWSPMWRTFAFSK